MQHDAISHKNGIMLGSLGVFGRSCGVNETACKPARYSWICRQAAGYLRHLSFGWVEFRLRHIRFGELRLSFGPRGSDMSALQNPVHFKLSLWLVDHF